MKRKMFFLQILAIAIFTSCSKTEDLPGVNPEIGVPTRANFTISVAETATKATTAGVAVESNVNNLSLYIFNKNGVLENSVDKPITSTDIDISINTTTGKKTIYAVVNPPTELSNLDLKAGYKLDDFKMLVVDVSSTSIADAATVEAGNFVMVGSVAIELESSIEETPIPINVYRMAAKIIVQCENAEQGNIDKLPDGYVFRLDNVKFLVAQTPINGYLSSRDIQPTAKYFPTLNGDNDVSSTFVDISGGSFTQSSTDNCTFEHLTLIPDVAGFETSAKAVIASGWGEDYVNSCYAPENMNRTPTTGNTTFVIIRLQLVSENDLTAGYEYWKEIDGEGEVVTFHTNGDDIEPAPGNSIVHHVDGYSYYRLNIQNNTLSNSEYGQARYSVIRNNMYRIDINEINGFGSHRPDTQEGLASSEDTAENTLIVEPVDIKATITVVDWNVIDMPSIIE